MLSKEQKVVVSAQAEIDATKKELATFKGEKTLAPKAVEAAQKSLEAAIAKLPERKALEAAKQRLATNEEQAKYIFRTDLKLNRLQKELEVKKEEAKAAAAQALYK